MTRSTDEIIGAVRAADDMPYGPARIESMLRLLDEVDRDGLHETESYVLVSLVEAYFFSGDTPRALVQFSRLRRLWGEQPERFDEYDRQAFFASMNWIVGGVQDDPTVPAAQILPLLDDMDELTAVAGLAGEAAAYERLRWSIRSEADDVEARFDTWRHAPRTVADCEFCERTRTAMVLVREERYDEIITLASAPGAPARNCPTDPADLWSLLAQAQLESGDATGAVRTHREFEATLPRTSTHMTMGRARRIATLGRGGALDAAVAAIEEDQDLLQRAVTPWLRLFFLTHVAAGTSALVRAGHDAPLRLRDLPARNVAELADWTRAEALALAEAFGERAGGRRLRERTAAEIDRPLPPHPLDFSVRVPAAASAAARGAATSSTPPAGLRAEHRDAETWEQALAEAERSVTTDLPAAAEAYGRAAVLADAAGALADAGFAYAELARCAELLRDPKAAHDAYRASVARLEAAEVDGVLTTAVLAAWAPIAADHGDSTDLLAATVRVRERLAVESDAGISDDRLRARREQKRTQALATLDETSARLLATDDPPTAFALAMSASNLHTASARADAAADAVWLAARIRQAAGQPDAPDVMLAAFAAAPRAARATIGAALVDALRAAGRHGEADDVLRELSGA